MYTANMIVRFRSMKLNFYYGHSLTYIEIDSELEKKKKKLDMLNSNGPENCTRIKIKSFPKYIMIN